MIAQVLASKNHESILSILARADEDRLKTFSETLIQPLGDIEVLQSRTGLVMLPMRDTAQGTAFHLGEVLVSEAHIQSDGIEAYGMRKGRDLETAMAMALIDLAIAKGVSLNACDGFISQEADVQRLVDEETLRKIEATRVNMETF